MDTGKLDEGAAIAVISFAVLEVFKTYRDTAPPIGEVRKASKHDWDVSQKLLDADLLSGLIVVLMGIAGAVLLNKKGPLVFLIITWVGVAGFYHLVRSGPHSYDEAAKEGLV